MEDIGEATCAGQAFQQACWAPFTGLAEMSPTPDQHGKESIHTISIELVWTRLRFKPVSGGILLTMLIYKRYIAWMAESSRRLSVPRNA